MRTGASIGLSAAASIAELTGAGPIKSGLANIIIEALGNAGSPYEARSTILRKHIIPINTMNLL